MTSLSHNTRADHLVVSPERNGCSLRRKGTSLNRCRSFVAEHVVNHPELSLIRYAWKGMWWCVATRDSTERSAGCGEESPHHGRMSHKVKRAFRSLVCRPTVVRTFLSASGALFSLLRASGWVSARQFWRAMRSIETQILRETNI